MVDYSKYALQANIELKGLADAIRTKIRESWLSDMSISNMTDKIDDIAYVDSSEASSTVGSIVSNTELSVNNSSLESKEELTDLADTIRAKTGITEKLSVVQMTHLVNNFARTFEFRLTMDGSDLYPSLTYSISCEREYDASTLGTIEVTETSETVFPIEYTFNEYISMTITEKYDHSYYSAERRQRVYQEVVEGTITFTGGLTKECIYDFLFRGDEGHSGSLRVFMSRDTESNEKELLHDLRQDDYHTGELYGSSEILPVNISHLNLYIDIGGNISNKISCYSSMTYDPRKEFQCIDYAYDNVYNITLTDIYIDFYEVDMYTSLKNPRFSISSKYSINTSTPFTVKADIYLENGTSYSSVELCTIYP